MQITNKWYTKVLVLVSAILVIVFILKYCINKNPYDFHYDYNERKLSFILLNEGDVKVDIYWNDNLIASPVVKYDKDEERYYVDVFPNSLIGGEKASPYLLDLCYEYSKNNILPLRYVITHNYYLEELDLVEEKIVTYEINVKKILDDEIIQRVSRLEKIEFPLLNLEGTGYCYLNYRDFPDFYKQTKSLLYEKGFRNIAEDLIHNTSYYWEMLKSLGYQSIEITNPPLFEEELATSLLMNVPDKWEKIYLLETSLSPQGKYMSTSEFPKILKEINKYVSDEFAENFKNAVVNKPGNVLIPIQLIGNHKYNFLKLLFLVTIDGDDNYQAIPIAYALCKDEIEKSKNENYGNRYIINSYIRNIQIGDYYMYYAGPSHAYELKRYNFKDYYDNVTISKPYILNDLLNQPQWNSYIIANSFQLCVPNTIELRGIDDLNTQTVEINGWHCRKIDNNNVVFQQKGLSNGEDEALNTYCRIMIAFEQNSKGSFPISTDIISLDEKTISAFQAQAIRSAGIFKVLEEPSVKLVKFGDFYAIEVKYVRSAVEENRTCVSTYYFYNNDKLAQITLSYREADKDKWEKDFEFVVKTYKWLS